MTLIWLFIFWIAGSDWEVVLGFGDAEFSTAAGWLVFCIACDLAGGSSSTVNR